MKKFLMGLLLFSATMPSCTRQPKDDAPQPTLEDSLLIVMSELFGDTTEMRTNLNGTKSYDFDMPFDYAKNYACHEKARNAFDRILRVERSDSKNLTVEPVSPSQTYVYSEYTWESYDYKAELYFLFRTHYTINDVDSVSDEGHATLRFLKK